MRNIVGAWISLLSDAMSSLDKSYNFLAPKDVVTYRNNWRQQSDTNLFIDENANWYIWKMFKDKESIYSESFLVWSLWYLLWKLKPWSKIVIQICRSVSELMNWKDDIEWTLSFEEQKALIISLVRKYHGSYFNDCSIEDKLNIIEMKDNNKDLFYILASEWIEWLCCNTKPKLDHENFTSKDIAKYLYRVARNDDLFLNKLIETKPKRLRSNNGPSDYYGMIEISVRLTDYLKWIRLQWWELRQNRYDSIIKEILFGRSLDNIHPMLLDLRQFCRSVVWDQSTHKQEWDISWGCPNWFSTIYFDAKKHHEYEKKKHNKNKLNRLIAWIWLSFVIVVWGYYWKTNWDRSRAEQEINRIIEIVLENKDIGIRMHWHYDKLNNEQKKVWLKNILDIAIYDFDMRYGLWNIDKEQFKIMVLWELLQWWSESLLRIFSAWNFFDQYVNNVNDFLDNTFITNIRNKIIFADVWTPIDYYWKYSRYKSGFMNSFRLLKDDWNDILHDDKFSLISLGTYMRRDWYEYEIGVLTCKENVSEIMTGLPFKCKWDKYTKEFIVAKWYGKEWYNMDDSLSVVRDFFNNTYLRKFSEEISIIIDRVFRQDQSTIISYLEIVDLMMDYDEMRYLNSPIDRDFKKKINFIRGKILWKNQEIMEKHWFTLIPYPDLSKYEQIFKDTYNLDVRKDVNKDDLYSSFDNRYNSYSSGNLKNINIINVFYYDQNWKQWILSKVTYKWKDYIVAFENYDNSYKVDLESFENWKKVAEDFLRIRWLI